MSKNAKFLTTYTSEQIMWSFHDAVVPAKDLIYLKL